MSVVAPQVDLLFSLHGVLLRALSERADRHFQGLHQAGRHFRHALSSVQRRRLDHLDTVFNYLRHVTGPLVNAFSEEIIMAVSLPGSPVCMDERSSCGSFASCGTRSPPSSPASPRPTAKLAGLPPRCLQMPSFSPWESLRTSPALTASWQHGPVSASSPLRRAVRLDGDTMPDAIPHMERGLMEADLALRELLDNCAAAPSSASGSRPRSPSTPRTAISKGLADSAAAPELQVTHAEEMLKEEFILLIDSASKAFRGQYHATVARLLNAGAPVDDVRGVIFEGYMNSTTLAWQQSGCGDRLPEWARDVVAQRASRDFMFFVPPAAVTCESASATVVQARASPCGGAGSQRRALNKDPGFGRGPRRTRKGT
uniref:Uncharacterized protein n=1 Tax=Zooxanthella nutricula TaxID=1333877 RepID=A0A7S2JWI2_9DINO|mmetsp:Transcript_36598/g.110590  ORF Transcript_36598/g.110590 Transcript_36598/m.110590 type:complete len:371 (+) Transcript_36598:111-1223(+)